MQCSTCGRSLTPAEPFCAGCGPPRTPSLAAPFRRIQDEYDQLKTRSAALQISATEMKAALYELLVEHDGAYWTIGAQSGRWYRYDGAAWIEATPPAADGAPATPQTLTMSAAPLTTSAADQARTTRTPTRFHPSHRVADRPLRVGGVPSGSYDPATTLPPGLEVCLLDTALAGWALVECENGWRCYVEAAGLVPIVGNARPASFRFCIEAPAWMQSSSGEAIHELSPGTWYEGLEEQPGWVRARAPSGVEGWVPAGAIRRG